MLPITYRSPATYDRNVLSVSKPAASSRHVSRPASRPTLQFGGIEDVLSLLSRKSRNQKTQLQMVEVIHSRGLGYRSDAEFQARKFLELIPKTDDVVRRAILSSVSGWRSFHDVRATVLQALATHGNDEIRRQILLQTMKGWQGDESLQRPILQQLLKTGDHSTPAEVLGIVSLWRSSPAKAELLKELARNTSKGNADVIQIGILAAVQNWGNGDFDLQAEILCILAERGDFALQQKIVQEIHTWPLNFSMKEQVSVLMKLVQYGQNQAVLKDVIQEISTWQKGSQGFFEEQSRVLETIARIGIPELNALIEQEIQRWPEQQTHALRTILDYQKEDL